MIIVDTGIWIDHLARCDNRLAGISDRLEALMHPYVLGELALGSLPDRDRLLQRFATLPQPPTVRHEHVLRLIDVKKLISTGIGYVDAHLLASALLLPGGLLWTRDKRLHKQAVRLDVAYVA